MAKSTLSIPKIDTFILIGKAHLLAVAQLVQVGLAGEVDHGRRATHNDQVVVARGCEMVADHVFTDEALAVAPALLGPVKRVPELEALGMSCLDLFQFVAEQDVVLGLCKI